MKTAAVPDIKANLNQKKKKQSGAIVFAVYSGFAARYLLRTDIFATIKFAGLPIVILTPNADEPYFQDEFAGENVFIEPLYTDQCAEYLRRSKIQKLLRRIRMQSQGHPDRNPTITMARRLYRETDGKNTGLVKKGIRIIESALARLLSRVRILRTALVSAESRWFAPRFHTEMYARFSPRVVVTTSLGYWHPDEFVMREAKLNGALVVPAILSWDNTSSYGMAAAPTDYIIAWTEAMKEELVLFHDIEPERIFVGGIAHFDIYYRKDNQLSRIELFRRLGLDEEKRLIFFATKSPNSYPWNTDIVEIIAKAIADGQLCRESQLLVRLHPIHYRFKNGNAVYSSELEKYRQIEQTFPFVSINEPEIKSKTLSMDSTNEDMVLLASILEHSDVMVNLFSTLSIEASIMDLPTINVAFEGETGKKRKPRDSIAFDEAQTHNQRVIQTGGVALSRNPDQLIDDINGYLENPALHRTGREKIRRQECGPFGGLAGRAIGEYFIELLTRKDFC